MQYQYKVVPFRGQIRAGFASVESVNMVSQQLEELINQYTQQGWEFVSVENVTLIISKGCLASLFGGGSSTTTYDQVIFRRTKE